MKKLFIIHKEEDPAVTCISCNETIEDYHKCKVSSKTEIIFLPCDANCKRCCEIYDRREWEKARWKKDEDNYTICGKCKTKLTGDKDYCEECYCENCDCVNCYCFECYRLEDVRMQRCKDCIDCDRGSSFMDKETGL